MSLVAGVDSSTQSCKIVIRDAETGRLVRQGRASHPDGTSVDPAAWWSALGTAIADAGGLSDVAAISVAGQQHGMVVLDAAGRVIRDALLWNDTRSAQAALDLIDEVGADAYAERVGVVPVASFTATKLRWLRDAEPENAARVAAVALPHDWLTWRLRGFGPEGESPLGPDLEQLRTDPSDASGTAYWSARSGQYDFELFTRALGRSARVAGASAAATAGASTPAGEVILPAIVAPGEAAGTGIDARLLTGAVADSPGGITSGVIVAGGAGDNAAAGLGLGAQSGDVVVSIGTSGTVFAVTDAAPNDPTGTVAGFAAASGEYLPLVCTLNAARILDAIAGLLGVDHTGLGTLALEAEPAARGLVLQPYFEGERTPNLPDATATLFGMTLDSTARPNLARAAIEGLLCGLADGLDAAREQGVDAQRILVIGGAAQNVAVQAIAAQVFDVPVVIPTPGEYVADGGAVQAAWALTGTRPDWALEISAAPAPNHHPEIRAGYAARAVR
ncbi:xylulose kinase [Mycetocola tolaasinivorans]|uniref:Xylulose kinase n=1 Tax=Mycetocola tolaasinivorans TaxID=76635 RepID=A0A3L7A1Q4_9MICO|nr:FGGY family carbohydrate kinase [Mycetocola tolaasinivorans]RLP74087.1 xylulose kinase [Mycetocola tolaasinivorans]